MPRDAAVISAFDRYRDADAAVKTLTGAGFSMRDLGIIGREYHTELAAAGFHSANGRIRLWGARGAFAGGLGALILGALFTPTSILGSVVVLGYAAAVFVCVIEGAAAIGGLSMMGAMSYSFLERKNGGLHYDRVTKAEGFLVVVRGNAAETARAKAIVAATRFERREFPDLMPAQVSDVPLLPPYVGAPGLSDALLAAH